MRRNEFADWLLRFFFFFVSSLLLILLCHDEISRWFCLILIFIFISSFYFSPHNALKRAQSISLVVRVLSNR